MPWGWDARGPVSVELGGSKGTPKEAKVAHAWPKYEAEYLRSRLEGASGKYGTGALNPDKAAVYLDKVADDYKQEADECLRAEFNDWLQGKHEDNSERTPYPNGPGMPVRRAVYREDGRLAPGEQMDGWRPTWWGKTQLTHLPGVRDYLRNNEEKGDKAAMQMNLLAEHGPQDLESAWMYFKHWVKGRPIGPEACIRDGEKALGNFSAFGPQQPKYDRTLRYKLRPRVTFGGSSPPGTDGGSSPPGDGGDEPPALEEEKQEDLKRDIDKAIEKATDEENKALVEVTTIEAIEEVEAIAEAQFALSTDPHTKSVIVHHLADVVEGMTRNLNDLSGVVYQNAPNRFQVAAGVGKGLYYGGELAGNVALNSARFAGGTLRTGWTISKAGWNTANFIATAANNQYEKYEKAKAAAKEQAGSSADLPALEDLSSADAYDSDEDLPSRTVNELTNMFEKMEKVTAAHSESLEWIPFRKSVKGQNLSRAEISRRYQEQKKR